MKCHETGKVNKFHFAQIIEQFQLACNTQWIIFCKEIWSYTI